MDFTPVHQHDVCHPLGLEGAEESSALPSRCIAECQVRLSDRMEHGVAVSRSAFLRGEIASSGPQKRTADSSVQEEPAVDHIEWREGLVPAGAGARGGIPGARGGVPGACGGVA